MRLVWHTATADGTVNVELMRRFGEFEHYAGASGIEVRDLHTVGDYCAGKNHAIDFAQFVDADRLLLVDACVAWRMNENVYLELERSLSDATAIGAVVLDERTSNPRVDPFRPRLACDVTWVATSVLLIDMRRLVELNSKRFDPWFDRTLTGDGCRVAIPSSQHFCRTLRKLGGKVRAHQGIPTWHVHRGSVLYEPSLTPGAIGGNG